MRSESSNLTSIVWRDKSLFFTGSVVNFVLVAPSKLKMNSLLTRCIFALSFCFLVLRGMVVLYNSISKMAVQNEHTIVPPELELPRTLHDDRHRFETVDVPVVTTSASFRSDIAHNLGEKTKELTTDIVFSRAHYSMAVGIMRAALEEKLNTWLIDPVNYVTGQDWDKVVFLAKTGKLIARLAILKRLKDLFDTVVRGKSPLTQVIPVPLI